MKFVKTHFADCFSGVRIRRAMQIEKVAKTLMGANQRTMRWRVLVAREQIMPAMTRMPMERRTICWELLGMVISGDLRFEIELTYGENA